jgi:hypothetical protein
MSLLSLTSGGVSFLVDENDIVRVYSVNSETKVDVLRSESSSINTVVVEESLSDIDTLSDSLIEVTTDGIEFLINKSLVREVLTNGTGSKIVYEGLIKQILTVEESPSVISLLVTPFPTPLQYKCLLSQNAPVATTTDPTMVAGQVWELEAYNAADAATIAALELVSGTLYAVGSKYRSATNQTLNVNAATTFSYDGSPYIVSTDANGDFNPSIDTTGLTITYERDAEGLFGVVYSGYTLGKTYPKISNYGSQMFATIIDGAGMGNGNFRIATFDAYDNTQTYDAYLTYTPFEIEIYP